MVAMDTTHHLARGSPTYFQEGEKEEKSKDQNKRKVTGNSRINLVTVSIVSQRKCVCVDIDQAFLTANLIQGNKCYNYNEITERHSTTVNLIISIYFGIIKAHYMKTLINKWNDKVIKTYGDEVLRQSKGTETFTKQSCYYSEHPISNQLKAYCTVNQASLKCSFFKHIDCQSDSINQCLICIPCMMVFITELTKQYLFSSGIAGVPQGCS
jgi:hypothetical protein